MKLGVVLWIYAVPVSLVAATVSWVGASGDWNIATNWSTGALPGPADDVVIDPGISIAVSHSTGVHTINSLLSQQAFVLSGGSLTVSTTVQVNNTFTFNGGTLADASIVQGTNGSPVVVAGNPNAIYPGGPFSATLDGVTIGAGCIFNASGFYVNVEVLNGLTVNGNFLLGRMVCQGTQALDGIGTISFGDPSNIIGVLGGTLTIASGITIHGVGGQLVGLASGDLIANNGTISADGSGMIIGSYGGSFGFINTGTLSVLNGGLMSVGQYASWTNAGTIVATSGTLTLAGVWTNAGTIGATNCAVNLGGALTTAALGTIERSGGSLSLSGYLDNTGSILNLDALGPMSLAGGTIHAGVIQSTNGALLYGTPSGGTLDGVTMNAPMQVVSLGTLTVSGGLVLNNTMTLGAPSTDGGKWGRADFVGTQTFSGSGDVLLNNPDSALYADSGSLLTIGSGLLVHGLAGHVGQNGAINGAIINQGTIDSDYANGTIYIDGILTNAGVLNVSYGTLQIRATFDSSHGSIHVGGGTLNLGGSMTAAGLNLGACSRTGGTVNLVGTLDCRGEVLDLDTTGPWYLLGGTIRNGTISTTNNPALICTSADVTPGGGTLDGVTLNAPIQVTHHAELSLVNGLVLNSVMTIGANNYYPDWGRVYCDGNETLGGVGEIIFAQDFNSIISSSDPDNGLSGVLTIGPGIKIHGRGGQLDGYRGPAIINQGSIVSDVPGGQIVICRVAGTFTNFGTLAVTANGASIITGAFSTEASFGSIDLQAGGLLDFIGLVEFDGANRLVTQPGSTLNLHGNLMGSTSNKTLYSALGTTIFNGLGTSANPQFLEAMGQDLGAVSAGFAHNFVYGTLLLANNTCVRLVDQSRNGSGTNAEALYVNSLIVPSGCTLDLNGLHVYARGKQIGGSVIGGTISMFSDGGTMALGSPTDGSIGTISQLDDWTFYGRAGQSFTIQLDLGSSNVLSPGMGYAEVLVLDPSTNLLTSASNSIANQVVTLTNVTLLADGTYHVQVHAPANHSTSVGNYQLTIWDATTNVLSLALNEQQNSQIVNPFKVDQWSFSANAGQQISFQLLNESAPGIAFDLTGPNGWVGFSNLTANSGLVDLPTSGNYALNVHSIGGDYGIDYAFELLQTAQTNITLGSSYTGSFSGSGQPQLFTITNPVNQQIRITLQNGGANNQAQLYVGFGFPPTPGNYSQAAQNGPGANQQILVNNAYAGNWYVLVYGNSITTPGNFTLSVDSDPLFMASLTPAQGGTGGTTTVEIQGAGFVSTAQVTLTGNGIAPITASNVAWVSPSVLVADLNLTSVPTNVYQLTVSQGTNSASLPFSVIGAAGPKFQAQLITPGGIGLDTVNTFYVEYSNTGDTPMPAPLLVVTALQSGLVSFCSETIHAQFSLDSSQLARDFWATSGPSAATEKATFFASGKIPGVLLPGESGRVPVYFLGMAVHFGDASCNTLPAGGRIVGWRIVQMPVASITGGSLNFQLFEFLPPNVATTGNGQSQADQPMNWQSILTNVPPNIQTDAWPVIWANYTNEAGNSLYSYFGLLQNQVNYLFRLGILGGGGAGINSVNDLANFAIIQADGLPLLRTLASATDGYAPTPSLRLSFDRTFPNTISGRYRLGRLGRGWSDNWDYSLTQATNGDVTIKIPGGGTRTFKPDLRGGYTADLGDYGQLVSPGGGLFNLNEKGGSVYSFNANGSLGSVLDPNGNSIVCGYTSGLLTSLSHSSGQSLAIGYTGLGRIQTVSDPVGRTTTFTYDATGEHLTNALYFDNKNVGYVYSIGNGATREHALTTVQNTDESHQFFSYDSRGRLQSTSREGGAELVTYTYDNAGTVFSTDAFTNTSKFFFDNRGLMVRMEDPQGHVTQLNRDAKFNLTSISDPAGRSYQYAHDNQGNVTGITDPLGNQTKFAYSGPFQRLSQLTDAKTNATYYGYDNRGNLLNISYADNSVESWGYQSCCEPTSWTNRRSQGIQYQFNPTNGFLMSKLYPDGSQAIYIYDSRGNLKTASNYTGLINMNYYPTNDRLQRITYPGGQWLQYTYDSAGRRQTMLDQLGYQLSYYYDNAGRLRSITNSQNTRIVLYQYDVAGRMQQKTLANGVYTTYGYDLAGHLQTLTNALTDGSVLSFFNYSYDERGRRRMVQTAFGLWTYDYDDLGQLTRAVLASTNTNIPNQDLTYVYDALGNRTSTIENGVTTPYAPNNLNQYASIGGTSYGFDADGNLLLENTSSGTNIFVYNTENRLTSVTQGKNDSLYTYDALGNRVTITQNGSLIRTIIDPIGLGNAIADYDGNGSLMAHYDHGLGLATRTDPSGSSGGYTFDAVGNVSELTYANGNIANHYNFAPFGGSISISRNISNPFEFAGEFGALSNPSGMCYMRHRYISTAIGRFTSTDGFGIAGGDVNLYRYAGNSPVLFIDPLGTDITTHGIMANAFGAALGGAAAASLEIAGLTTATSVALPLVVGTFVGGASTLVLGDGASLATLENAALATSISGALGIIVVEAGFVGTVAGAAVIAPAFIIYFAANFIVDRIIDLNQEETFAHNVTMSSDWNAIYNDLSPQAQTIQACVPIYAYDPNQKIVMAGQGTGGLVQAGTILPYRIDFENDTNATAPAQRVVITDQLTNTLDWTTFELTEIQFGDQYIFVPAGTQSFQTNMPVTINGASFVVQIQTGLNSVNGKFSATFQSVDPNSDLPPPANVGFLPPEDGFGRGRGHVAYLVRPKANLPSGTQIRNTALVQFDNGEIIATDQVAEHDPSQGVDPTKQALVTVDSALPSSTITALPSVQTNTTFTVCWTGSDNFSTVTGYDVYLSTNNGPWTLWQTHTTNTCAPFTGQLGNRYSFFSVAHNAVGYTGIPPYGSGTGTVVAPHLAPQIMPVPNQSIAVGQHLILTNSAQDPDHPITFSLDKTAPAGATIKSTNGVLTWVPSCSQASTTNPVTIWATDNYSIPLSNSMSFVVIVGECLQMGVGSTVLQIGQTSSVPVSIISTLGLTNLSFTVAYPSNRFTNWVMTASNNAIGATLVQTIDSSQTAFSVAAKNGQAFKGPGVIGSLSFKAQPGASAFVPLSPTNVVGIKADGSAVGNSEGQAGRAVVIGQQPLLEPWVGSNATRMLTLYGNPGSSYQTLFNTNLLTTNWLVGWRVPMTNLYQFYSVDQNAPQIYYRAWEFFADPPILELNQASGTNLVLLLYGKVGTNYFIQATTNLAARNAWPPYMNFTLSNSFRFISNGGPTNSVMLFRAQRP